MVEKGTWLPPGDYTRGADRGGESDQRCARSEEAELDTSMVVPNAAR